MGPLKVSLTREQYNQLLETINNLFIKISDSTEPEVAPHATKLGDIQEEDNVDSMFGVSTLSLDPALRAKMLNSTSVGHSFKPSITNSSSSSSLALRGSIIIFNDFIKMR